MAPWPTKCRTSLRSALLMPELAKTPFDDLEPSAVLKPKDVAERLDVDARSVRRAITRGELIASRTCGIRILAGDAAAWWRARVIVAAAKARPETPPEAIAPDGASTPSVAVRPRSVKRTKRSPGRLPLPARTRGS